MANKIYLEYKEIHNHIKYIIDILFNFHRTRKFEGVFGVPKGGVVFATHIAYALNIAIFYNIDDILDKNNIILCDDICDSGETINNILSKIDKSKLFITTLYKKPRAILKPDIYFKEYNNDDWIVFPWEESYNIIDKTYMT